jgi:hypothetical protein
MSIEADECATRDMELLPALRAAELDYTLEWGSGDLYGAAADEIEHLRAALDAAPKPLDDPRLQGLFSDAISGALAFGAQNTNPPPAGHWLERFWQMGRAERALSEAAPPAAEPVAWRARYHAHGAWNATLFPLKGDELDWARKQWPEYEQQPLYTAAPAAPEAPAPIDMVLHCPACGRQHIDAPDERTADWKNEPHRSHLCAQCGFVWRPADVPTNGVATIKTRGKNDS